MSPFDTLHSGLQEILEDTAYCITGIIVMWLYVKTNIYRWGVCGGIYIYCCTPRSNDGGGVVHFLGFFCYFLRFFCFVSVFVTVCSGVSGVISIS